MQLNLIPDDPTVDSLKWVAPRAADLSAPPPESGLSLEAWIQVLAHEAVWVDGYPRGLEAPGRLEAGSKVVIYLYQEAPSPLDVPLEILHDAEGVVAVNKPAGLSTQRSRASARRCLQWLLQRQLDDPGLRAVHRLDRDTSGVVLFARDKASTAALHAQFRDRRVDKRYLAVTAGVPERVAFTVEGHMHRIPPKRDPLLPEGVQRGRPAQLKLTMSEIPQPGLDSKPSETRFTRLRQLGERAVVEARPITGRTHQIRVHLDHLGLPICGDRLYGDASSPRQRAPRLMLHAARIEVPTSRRPLIVECPAPDAFTLGWESTP